MVFLVFYFFFSHIVYADNFCTKTGEIIEIESLSFPNVPWDKLRNLKLSKYRSVSYDIFKNKKNLKIKFKIKCKNNKFKIKFKTNTSFNKELNLILQNKFKKSTQLNIVQSVNIISKFLQRKGYQDNKVNINKIKTEQVITYNIFITLGLKHRFSKIVLVGNLPAVISSELNKKFVNIISSRDNSIMIIDFLNRALVKLKYKFYNIKYKIIDYKNNKKLVITVINLSKLYLHIKSKYIINISNLNSFLYSEIKDIKDISKTEILNKIDRYFKTKGWFKTKVKLESYHSTKDSVDYRYIFLTISGGVKKKVSKIEFENSKGQSSELLKLYYRFASDMASAGYWDKEYLIEFKAILTNYLYSVGYAYHIVNSPKIVMKGNDVNIKYNLHLKKRVIISSIKILGKNNIFTPINILLDNKVGRYLNITKVKSDLQRCFNYYKSIGHLFTKIYKTDRKIISYSNGKAELLFPITIGKRAILNKITLKGKIKTKKYIIWREINLKKNDVITSKKLQRLRNSLLSLGLFQTVNIKLIPQEKTDFINTIIEIELIEKKFGVALIKPGFRTDLGFKLGTKISYNNIMHKHHQISFQVNGNKRITNDGLELSRLKLRENFIEFDTHLIYSIPYFISNISLSNSISRQKYMFYSFDAVITKLRESLSKRLSRHFEVYSIYQFENIDQFFGTLEIDNDTFKIGSLSLGIVSDHLDRKIFPRNGYWGNFSIELTHPGLGALKNNNGEINFYRFLAQNKFYKSFNKNVFAFSTNFGFAENLSKTRIVSSNGASLTKGYIPSIKVFRLSGVESIRGYLEDEVNRINNRDISEYRIDNKVMYLSSKMEFRIPVSENLYWGPFYDFGNVYINNFKIQNLRQAIGLIIKFLTPVGTIDLSYGIKLKKVTNSLYNETFGQFNLKIGSF